VNAADDVRRPVALVTGVGRRAGIGAALATRLARQDYDVAVSYWSPYDDRMPWPTPPGAVAEVCAAIRATGARALAVADDLADVEAPRRIFDAVEAELGPVTALVLSHAESVDSGLLDTSLDSWDRHFAVNARASWLLVRELAERFRGPPGRGRIVALTSDHTAFNLPYGASKGALDRVVLAAARELAGRGITANVVNPGPNDTGWMSDELKARVVDETPLGRLGRPSDTAALVGFLCSPEGEWVNGQLLHSDGGLHA
jgi:3-oxoacyl-[acyl-carrier protein] reductase